MTSVLLLDSTVLIDYPRGRAAADRVDALLDSGETLVTTGINVEEIARGLRPDEEDGARRLFAGLAILPIGADEGWLAGTWRRQAARQGVTVAQAACLIAAAAMISTARLATGNPKDFRHMSVEVEHWPVGR